MKERIARLYEQGADAVSIRQYVRRWLRWIIADVGDILNKSVLVIMGEMSDGIFKKDRYVHYSYI